MSCIKRLETDALHSGSCMLHAYWQSAQSTVPATGKGMTVTVYRWLHCLYIAEQSNLNAPGNLA